MDHLVVTAWVGAGALYVFFLWCLVDGHRHHLSARTEMTLGELAVLLIYLLVFTASVIQEGVVYRAITYPAS